MYIRDLVSSVTRPVKELKGFQQDLAGAGRNEDGRASTSRPICWRSTTST